jgi:hypothetical protein
MCEQAWLFPLLVHFIQLELVHVMCKFNPMC